MAVPLEDKNYYAIKSDTVSSSTSGGKWADSAQTLAAGTISLADAQEGDTVKCSTSVKIDLSGSMAGSLQDGDAKITLKGLGFDSVEEYDLKTVQDAGNTQTITGTGKLELKGATETKNLTADVWIVNKQNEEQNHLAGKELTVKFTIEASDCETTSPAGD